MDSKCRAFKSGKEKRKELILCDCIVYLYPSRFRVRMLQLKFLLCSLAQLCQGPIGASSSLAHSGRGTGCNLHPIGFTRISGQAGMDEVGVVDVTVLCNFLLGPGISSGHV